MRKVMRSSATTIKHCRVFLGMNNEWDVGGGRVDLLARNGN